MENKKFIAICNQTKKTFNDYKNISGALTRHLSSLNPNIIIPSSFIRRQYKSNNNKYWHEQFFEIIEDKNILTIKKCKFCNWTTKDLNNKSGQYTTHLLKEHNISIEKYLKQFPEEENLFETFIKNKKDKKEMLSNDNNFIICKICNKKLKSLTNTHLKKHNITLSDYKLNFPNDDYHSKNFIIKKTSFNLEIATKNIKNSYVSKPEKSLKEFLHSLDLKFDNNNRKFLNGVEIDILDHKNKIGIEFNGNLYHSENYGGKLKNFHLNKTKLMNKKGYSLIHIFEDEWILKNEIVKNKLKYLFNKIEGDIIHARKCIIKEISSIEKNKFLEKYHIQGGDRSNIHIGAYFNKELVSVMTFDNKRQMSGVKNKNLYELKRFCNSYKVIITGIANRLLKFFIEKYKPQKIISFADRRWTLNINNNLYTKLNFKLVKTLAPDYSYFNQKIHRLKRYHKFSFGKSSLKNKFPQIYNENKTEWEIMQELKYDRVWDCGKFKYELCL